jgi:hypothetical protein
MIREEEGYIVRLFSDVTAVRGVEELHVPA